MVIEELVEKYEILTDREGNKRVGMRVAVMHNLFFRATHVSLKRELTLMVNDYCACRNSRAFASSNMKVVLLHAAKEVFS